MTRSQFWKIIDASKRNSRDGLDGQVESLREQLKSLSPKEIVSFQAIFDDYWVRAYR